MYSKLVEKISKQQAGKEGTPAWMVGEQLKEICKNNAQAIDIVIKDLDIPNLSISEAAKAIKKFADKNRTGNFSCVIPSRAEKIIREFYGIGNLEASLQTEYIDLESYLK